MLLLNPEVPQADRTEKELSHGSEMLVSLGERSGELPLQTMATVQWRPALLYSILLCWGGAERKKLAFF